MRFTRFAAAVAIAAAAACGGSDAPTAPTAPPVTNQPTPAPAPTTIAMDGLVTETAPTTGTVVPGATVRITSGPQAGLTRDADGNGYYVFPEISPGVFTVEVGAPNFESATFNVNRTASTTGRQNFAIRPNQGTVEETYNGQVSGSDAHCLTTFGGQPCTVVSFGVHYGGTVDVALTWVSDTSDLDIYLYQGTTQVASDIGPNDFRDRNQRAVLSSPVQAGLDYELRIAFYTGSAGQVQPFTLHVRRPN